MSPRLQWKTFTCPPRGGTNMLDSVMIDGHAGLRLTYLVMSCQAAAPVYFQGNDRKAYTLSVADISLSDSLSSSFTVHLSPSLPDEQKLHADFQTSIFFPFQASCIHHSETQFEMTKRDRRRVWVECNVCVNHSIQSLLQNDGGCSAQRVVDL